MTRGYELRNFPETEALLIKIWEVCDVSFSIYLIFTSDFVRKALTHNLLQILCPRNVLVCTRKGY